MSAHGRPSATSDSRPTYPQIEAEIGEDPARYLHEPGETAWARIRGIASMQVLDAWVAVEEDLGPRKEVMKHLNQRRLELRDQQEEGEE